MQVIITIWKGICLLPAALQKIFGQVLGNLLLVIASKRKRIAQVNIQTCFPLLTFQEQNKLLHQNFKFLGASIFQTGSAWFWSDAQIQKHVEYEIRGLELLNNTKEQSGNLVLFKHSQHLELDARLLGLNAEIYGVGRSHNSPIMNKLQTQGRLSSIQATADKNNPRKFLAWLKKGKMFSMPWIKIMAGKTLLNSRFLRLQLQQLPQQEKLLILLNAIYYLLIHTL